jgi:hypothetical protein
MHSESAPLNSNQGFTDPVVLAERSLYMRLYLSLKDGDAFYPAAFCQGIEVLAERGHAEPCKQGWRMTETGVLFWTGEDGINTDLKARKKSWYLKKKAERQKAKLARQE